MFGIKYYLYIHVCLVYPTKAWSQNGIEMSNLKVSEFRLQSNFILVGHFFQTAILNVISGSVVSFQLVCHRLIRYLYCIKIFILCQYMLLIKARLVKDCSASNNNESLKYIIVLFVETPRKFITAKLSRSGLTDRKLCSNKFMWCFHKQNYYKESLDEQYILLLYCMHSNSGLIYDSCMCAKYSFSMLCL